MSDLRKDLSSAKYYEYMDNIPIGIAIIKAEENF